MAIDPLDIKINISEEGKEIFSRMETEMGRLGETSSKVSANVVAFGVAVGAVAAQIAEKLFTAVKDALSVTSQWGEQLDQLGDMFGMSGEQASGWATAFAHVGLSAAEGAQQLNYFTRNLDNMSESAKAAATTTKDNSEKIASLKDKLADAQTHLERVTKTMTDAKTPTDAMKYAVADAKDKVADLTKELADTPATITKTSEKASDFEKALQSLGVSAKDSNGKLKSFDEIMPEIMDHFEKLPAGVNASALAMDLFGARGGSKFLDFLRQGGDSIKDFTALAKEMGLSMSTETVNGIEELGFAFNDLKLGVQGVFSTIGTAFLPLLKELTDYTNKEILPNVASIAKTVAPAIQKALTNLGDLFGDVMAKFKKADMRGGFSELYSGILKILGVSTDVANAIGNVMGIVGDTLYSTIGGIRDAVVMLVTELAQGKIAQGFADFAAKILETFGVSKDSANTFGKDFGNMAAKVVSFVQQIIGAFGELFLGFTTGLAALGLGKFTADVLQAFGVSAESANAFGMEVYKLADRIGVMFGKLKDAFGDLFYGLSNDMAAQGLGKFTADVLQAFGMSKESANGFGETVRDIAAKVGEILGVLGDTIKLVFQGKFKDAVVTLTSGMLQALGVSEETADGIGKFVGDMAAKIYEIFGKIKDAFGDLLAEFGKGKIAEGLGEFTSTVLQAFGMSEESANAFGTVIQTLVQIMVDAVNWVKKHWPEIQKTIEEVWKFVKPILDKVIEVIKEIWAVVQVVFKKIEEFVKAHGQQLANILSGIWDVIVGVGQLQWGLLYYFIKMTLDLLTLDFKAFGEDGMSLSNLMMDSLQKIFGGGFAIISNTIGIAFDEILKGIQSDMQEVGQVVENTIGGAISWLAGIPGQMLKIGSDIVQGIINGITGMGGALVESLQNIVTSAVDAAKSSLGIHSPSAVFADIGKNMALGLANGFEMPSLNLDASVLGHMSLAGAGGYSAGSAGAASGSPARPIQIIAIGATRQEVQDALQPYIEAGAMTARQLRVGTT